MLAICRVAFSFFGLCAILTSGEKRSRLDRHSFALVQLQAGILNLESNNASHLDSCRHRFVRRGKLRARKWGYACGLSKSAGRSVDPVACLMKIDNCAGFHSPK